MASAIVIPIIIVAILGLSGYLIYHFVISDALRKSEVNRTLRRYDIQKTPAQIIREYHEMIGTPESERRVHDLEKEYRQTDPDQFLSMYDALRENSQRSSDK